MNIEFRPVRVRLWSLADEQAAVDQAKAEAEKAAAVSRLELRDVTYEYCPGADRWIMAPGELSRNKDFTGLAYSYSPADFADALLDELEDGIYGSANPGHVAAEEDRDTIMWPSEKFDAYCRDVAQAVAEDRHASDCATHNEPAMPNGPCDCDLDALRCEFATGDVVTFKSGGAWMTVECVDLHQDSTFTADLIWTDVQGRLYELDGIDVRLLCGGVKLSWLP